MPPDCSSDNVAWTSLAEIFCQHYYYFQLPGEPPSPCSINHCDLGSSSDSDSGEAETKYKCSHIVQRLLFKFTCVWQYSCGLHPFIHPLQRNATPPINIADVFMYLRIYAIVLVTSTSSYISSLVQHQCILYTLLYIWVFIQLYTSSFVQRPSVNIW